ncbi:MAG: ribosome-associated translation inhibitor RaiA [Patescibacteria group bacterium]
MKIITKGNHMDVTPAIQEYLDKRLQGLEKFLDENAMIEAELGKTSNHHRSGDIFRAELHVTNGGNFTRASAEKEDLYTAIDVAREELFNLLSSSKDKKQTLWKRGGQRIKNLIRGITDR